MVTKVVFTYRFFLYNDIEQYAEWLEENVISADGCDQWRWVLACDPPYLDMILFTYEADAIAFKLKFNV